jgi:hypothetical protein
VESAVELLVLALALVAAWLSVRSTPELDWERLWKTVLATCIRGQVEQSDGDSEEWWSRLAVVPFHPAGRLAYEKLFRPSLSDIPVPALPGEQALVESLSALDDPEDRFKFMYRQAEAAQDALMSDPALLGPAYAPSAAMPPRVGWEEVAAWDAEVQRSIARRMHDVVVAVVGMDTLALADAVPHGAVVAIEGVDAEAFSAPLDQDHQRLVIVARGDAVVDVIKLLHGEPLLRDRVLAVISLGGAIQGEGNKAWIDKHFQHTEFDTELNRRTLYMAASDPGRPLVDASDQRFPDPPVPPSGWAPIEAVDLGPLPLIEQDPAVLARALWVLLCFCVSTR